MESENLNVCDEQYERMIEFLNALQQKDSPWMEVSPSPITDSSRNMMMLVLVVIVVIRMVIKGIMIG